MKKLAVAIGLTLPSICAAEHSLPIEVTEIVGERQGQSISPAMNSHAPLSSPVHDAGALLRSVTGMDAARRGGRGFDPIIRGQSENQINVISDGAYNFGGCPSRMDPPTTYIGFDNFDQVTVIKGSRSVIYGAGGSGGTLLFEHRRPTFTDKAYVGEIVGGYTSNSDIDSYSANLAVGNDDGFIRAYGERKQSGNYEDGDGNTVSSAFDSLNSGVIAGYDLTPENYLQLSYEQVEEEDIFYAGNGMDAPYADSTTQRLKWEHSGDWLALDGFELTVYRSDVDHLMDNYTLRERNPMPTGMATPTNSDTWGGRFLGRIETADYILRLGLDHLANDRLATAFRDIGKDGSYDMIVALMWPGLEMRRTGVFMELDYHLTEKDTARLGLRYDEFELDATQADTAVGMMNSGTPSLLYQTYYGSDSTENRSEDIGVVLGWDRRLESDKLFSVNISRSVRHPDSNEAFMARNVMNVVWVGNPDLEAEIHQQLDLTLMGNDGENEWSTSIYWNEVDDYIERYQDGNATLYRNISASLRGLEADLKRPLTDNIHGLVGLAYTRGEGENGDLAGISPLTGRIAVTYEATRWTLGAQMIAADNQPNFDEDVDVNEETRGFAVINLFANWNPVDSVLIEAGVENLFDRQYAYHVNKASRDPFDPTAIRVFEPGRQAWVRARYTF